MSSERVSCYLTNVLNGKKYDLPYDKKFFIGRSEYCSIIIDERYDDVVTWLHCAIEYNKNNNNFVIYNFDRNLGTFIDGQKLQKGCPATLKHGDLISIGLYDKKWYFIYKFSICSNDGKKSKFDKNIQEDTVAIINIKNENYKKSLLKLHSEVINLKDKNRIMINTTKAKMSDFQKIINETVERASKVITMSNINYITVVKQKDIIDDLTKKVSEYHGTLLIQKERLENKYIHQKSSIELFKSQINNLLEKYLQCPVCTKVLFKITNLEKSSQMLYQHMHCIKCSPCAILLVCLFVIGIILLNEK